MNYPDDEFEAAMAALREEPADDCARMAEFLPGGSVVVAAGSASARMEAADDAARRVRKAEREHVIALLRDKGSGDG